MTDIRMSAKLQSMEKEPKKRGPVPDSLKIEGDWRGAVKKALKKKRPEKC